MLRREEVELDLLTHSDIQRGRAVGEVGAGIDDVYAVDSRGGFSG